MRIGKVNDGLQASAGLLGWGSSQYFKVNFVDQTLKYNDMNLLTPRLMFSTLTNIAQYSGCMLLLTSCSEEDDKRAEHVILAAMLTTGRSNTAKRRMGILVKTTL